MGTHPIFESDFDCLTVWLKMLGGPSQSDQQYQQAMAMAAQNPLLEIENIKEFFQSLNNMAVTCFDNCVTSFRSTGFEEEAKELTCLENCVGKHMQANRRVIENFSRVQETFALKTKEYEDEQMKKLIEVGIFDANLMLQPKEPLSVKEQELRMIESWPTPLKWSYQKYYNL